MPHIDFISFSSTYGAFNTCHIVSKNLKFDIVGFSRFKVNVYEVYETCHPSLVGVSWVDGVQNISSGSADPVSVRGLIG